MKQEEKFTDLELMQQAVIQKLQEDKIEMAHDCQRHFTLSQTLAKLFGLLGTNVPNVIRGDYSTHPVSEEERKRIKREINEGFKEDII
ncbi:hypothetical protein [Fructobacillus fructosus]|uniref:Uncharacterized protein n=1 Tax=Fructobacillus fructosus TaxID=1631 RepID=A0ABN9YMT9_9LACO|nr:hypothetical protein [Fructobacillus fructosus]MBC9119417.1 hypothetical protein [Fructobacillus fructosus]MBD9366928.1 hypothetical protein [Leuconostoc mesenteroides]CAK1233451.1 unnamed protein product [Fructobacillus fructosus]